MMKEDILVCPRTSMSTEDIPSNYSSKSISKRRIQIMPMIFPAIRNLRPTDFTRPRKHL